MNALFFALAASAYAHAFPALGDRVDFAVTVEKNGATQSGTFTHELTQHDSAKKQWLEVTTVTLAGQAPEISQTQEKDNALQTPQKISLLLQECAVVGGTSVKINVPAGTFDTCHMRTANGADTAEYWFGQVPFAVVRFITTHEGAVNTGNLVRARAPMAY